MTAPTIHGEGVLGRKVEGALRQLDTFDLPDSVTNIILTSDEFTAVCPITGQPDWYTVEIRLMGPRYGIESKSLKLYLQSFRNEGAFCESLADIIATDVLQAVKRGGVTVTLTQKSRGGITIEARSTQVQPERMGDDDEGDAE